MIMTQLETIGAVLMVFVFVGLGVVGLIIANHKSDKDSHHKAHA